MTVRTKRGRKGRPAQNTAQTDRDAAEDQRKAREAELKPVIAMLAEQKRLERNARARMSRRRNAIINRGLVLPSKGILPTEGSFEDSTGSQRKRAPAAVETKPKRVAENYRRPPRNRRERLRRHSEQRRIARQNGLDWRKLTFWERRKRIRFGTNAQCRSASDARDLARITGMIAHGREKAAVSNWGLDPSQQDTFSALCGFKRPPGLVVSNKRVRTNAAYKLAKTMMRHFKSGSQLHFYFVTVIHDGWHTRHDRTIINLDGIHYAITAALNHSGLGWLGMVEIDLFNNYPGKGQGLWVAPHGHAFMWSTKPIKPQKLSAQFARAGKFSSSLTSKPVKIQRITSAKDVAHLSFYITKPNYQCKAVGRENLTTGKPSVYTVEKAVRPAYTLRIAEILSYFSLSDLVLAGGEGVEFARKWLGSLERRQKQLGGGFIPSVNPVEFWDSIRPGRSIAAPIQVVKRSGRARKQIVLVRPKIMAADRIA